MRRIQKKFFKKRFLKKREYKEKRVQRKESTKKKGIFCMIQKMPLLSKGNLDYEVGKLKAK